MATWRRRSVLANCAALSTIGALASIGPATADGDASSGDSVVGWSSHRGNAANNAYFPDRSAPEPPVTVDWERDSNGPIAVVDDAIYQTTSEAVHALTAADGEVKWESGTIGAAGTPAVASGTVYVGGDHLSALDAADGTVRWQVDFDSADEVPPPTVADGTVFVVTDATLYALDADDGGEQWRFEVDDGLFDVPATVADGAVFVFDDQHVYAREVADGRERWTNAVPESEGEFVGYGPLVAGDGLVAVAVHDGESVYANDVVLYETETGDEFEWYGGAVPAAITDDRVYTNPTHNAAGYDRETSEQVWELDQQLDLPTLQAQRPIVGEDAVYVGIDGDAFEDRRYGVYAFDADGSVAWSITPGYRLDATLVDGTVYARGWDYEQERGRLLAIRSDSDGGNDDEDGENDTDDRSGDESANENDAETDTGTDGDADESDREDAGTDGDVDESDAGDTGTDGDADESDGEDAETAGNADEDDDTGADGDDEAGGDDGSSDGSPGFTTGAGILGGAATLEWLRRTAGVDESTGASERSE